MLNNIFGLQQTFLLLHLYETVSDSITHKCENLYFKSSYCICLNVYWLISDRALYNTASEHYFNNQKQLEQCNPFPSSWQHLSQDLNLNDCSRYKSVQPDTPINVFINIINYVLFKEFGGKKIEALVIFDPLPVICIRNIIHIPE